MCVVSEYAQLITPCTKCRRGTFYPKYGFLFDATPRIKRSHLVERRMSIPAKPPSFPSSCIYSGDCNPRKERPCGSEVTRRKHLAYSTEG
jgi:hypothetical protein